MNKEKTIRKNKDNSTIDYDAIQNNPNRQLANKILDGIDDYIVNKFGESMFNNYLGDFDDNGEEHIIEGLFGDSYYDLEDLVTEIIKRN